MTELQKDKACKEDPSCHTCPLLPSYNSLIWALQPQGSGLLGPT